MATIGFPANPQDGDQFTSGTTTYVYDGTKSVWKRASGVPSGATVPSALDDFGDVDIAVQPETATLDATVNTTSDWLWSYAQSELPFARTTSVNKSHSYIPLYKQSTYQINNFANTLHGTLPQTHSFRLKWIKGAGNDNLVDWPTITETSYSNPNINDGNAILVERHDFTVPTTIAPPVLSAPSVTYDVSFVNAGAYTFSGVAVGDNPTIGPLYRGGTYTFNITATGHPFYFTTDNGAAFSSTQYINEYTDGVTGSRTENGTVTFVVPNDAPAELYYQCGVHSTMRGSIEIRDLAVETDADGNYIIYGQHDNEGYEQAFEIRDLPGLVNQMCLVYDATTSKWRLQDLATYADKTPAFQNKIKELTGTTSLVNADGTSLVASVQIFSTSALLPYTNNVDGDLAFIQDTQELKVWKAGIGWNAVTSGSGSTNAPTVSAVSPVSYDGNEGTTFTITGTNFTVGSVVTFITSGGAEYNAATTSVVSSTTINCTTPRDFLETDSDLSIRVTNPKGQIAGLANVIQTGGAPVWTTSSGTLYQNAWPDDVVSGDNSYRNNMEIDEQIVATDPDGQDITYSIQSGSLPPNTSLNPETGAITGGPTGDIGGDNTYSFVAGAEDESSNLVTRPFNIIVKNIGAPLYSFTSATFTNGGIIGSTPATYNDIATNITGTFGADMLNDPLNFTVDSGYIRWRVPGGGTYRITTIGASGQDGNQYSGGYGAYNRGTFATLATGEYLHMLIGQRGTTPSSTNYGAGGGGGTFVTLENSSFPNDRASVTPLIVAAGGGGAGRDGTYTHGNGGSASGNITNTSSAGTQGQYNGGGAAGYADSYEISVAEYDWAYSFISSGLGGIGQYSDGGFGGGGSDSLHLGGGGGGYSGGNGGYLGTNGATNGTPSTGGLSFNSGTSQTNSTEATERHGKIIIEKIA